MPPPSCLAPGLHCRRPVRSKGVHNRSGPYSVFDEPRARQATRTLNHTKALGADVTYGS